MKTDRNVRQLAKLGHYAELKRLWDDGARFDLATVFERAVTDFRSVKRTSGHLDILRFCIDHGLDVESRADWLGQPIICSAAMYGNNAIIDYMRTKELPRNPFVRASIGDIDCLQQLTDSLTQGKKNATKKNRNLSELIDANGFNLLHYAAGSGLGRSDDGMKDSLLRTCEMLVAQGVDTSLSVENEIAITPVLMCAWFGGNPAVIKLLIESKEVDVAGLHQPVEFTLEPHQRSGEPFHDVAAAILDHGFNINSIRPDQGRTLLHGSSHRASTQAVGWLLQNGADPNATDDQRRTPLHLCALRNTHGSVASLLVRNGADADAVDKSGKTALDYARENNRKRVAEILSSASGHRQ